MLRLITSMLWVSGIFHGHFAQWLAVNKPCLPIVRRLLWKQTTTHSTCNDNPIWHLTLFICTSQYKKISEQIVCQFQIGLELCSAWKRPQSWRWQRPHSRLVWRLRTVGPYTQVVRWQARTGVNANSRSLLAARPRCPRLQFHHSSDKQVGWWEEQKMVTARQMYASGSGRLFAPFPSSADTICINWLFQYIYDIIHRTCRRTEKWENWVMIWVTRKSCCKKGVLTNGRDLIYVCTLNISKRSSALSEVI